jgi:4-amino-4-deoxy-L-arabinose transferase-like glycosyltransferase
MLKVMTFLSKVNKYFWLILLLAFALRLVGIRHGLPHIFHVDEPALVRAALGMRFEINPGHFDWPHLFTYANFFVYGIFAKFRDLMDLAGLRPLLSGVFPLMWNDQVVFYLVSRIFAAILGALTVIPVYLAGKKLFNENIALFGALAMTVIPFHVRHSHYSLIDVPMTFFVAWALYFSVMIMFNKNFKYYLLAGLFVGLAASTKYNGGLVAITVVLAHFIRVFRTKEHVFGIKAVRNLLLSGVLAITGFVAGTPFALLDFKTFSRTDTPAGAFWQFTNVGSVDFLGRIENFMEVLFTASKFPSHMGYSLLIGAGIVVGVAVTDVIRRKATEVSLNVWILIISALFLILYISGFQKTRAHYFMPSYPFIALLAGYFAYGLFKWFDKTKRWMAIVAMIVFFGLPFIYSVGEIIDLNRPRVIDENTRIYGGEGVNR